MTDCGSVWAFIVVFNILSLRAQGFRSRPALVVFLGKLRRERERERYVVSCRAVPDTLISVRSQLGPHTTCWSTDTGSTTTNIWRHFRPSLNHMAANCRKYKICNDRAALGSENFLLLILCRSQVNKKISNKKNSASNHFHILENFQVSWKSPHIEPRFPNIQLVSHTGLINKIYKRNILKLDCH